LTKIKMARKFGFIQGTMVNLVRSGMIVVLLFLIFDKELSAGQYFTFLLYSLFLFNPLQEMNKVLQSGREAQVSLNQLGKILARPFEHQPDQPAGLDKITQIKFEKVGFTYAGKENGIDDISFDVKSGETIAFVGPSGSGKSTIVKLIVRLYSPSKGKILFNGERENTIHKDAIRKKTGIVTQDTHLFSGSIRDNLLFVSPGASDEDCIKVLDRSACEELLKRAPGQLSSMIGEGGMKISGGERQRIAIARALLRHPDLLIFDEATSALDSITEMEITKTVQDIARSGDQITILVAHRLSTIQYADRIYVMEDGRMAETGNHKELLAKKGLYFAMWRQQSGVVNE